MQVNIQGSDIANRPAIRRHIEQRILFELSRYGERIGMVRVRVAERPRAADNKKYHCGIAVSIDHAEGTPGIVLARGQDDDLHVLIAAVIERAGRLAGGEIMRADAAREARAQWIQAGAGAANGVST
jgi:ribosomal subunit interface protein